MFKNQPLANAMAVKIINGNVNLIQACEIRKKRQPTTKGH
jgi:hypothetical protein